MALRTPLTAQPHLYIGDSTGRPLDYGRVYFGEPNKDPEFYPIDIYLDPEMTIAAAQPVRTKGGFMDVGGNLAELHAAEVVYSLKVLDQYGRQVFYKPEMYRNNVSDFLVDEITRATAAETLIAGNLTAETQRAITAEKVIADAVVTEKDRAVAAENALDAKHAALSSTINSLGGGKKAYTTYALMVADKNNIAANSSIDVTNDTDPLKNGTYSYDGAVFAKSIYDVETIVRTKVLNTFKTKALMDASVLPDGADAQVTDDTVNNGLYVKTAGAWVKSAYDPLAQANTYTDSITQPIETSISPIIGALKVDESATLFEIKDKKGEVVLNLAPDANLYVIGNTLSIQQQFAKQANENKFMRALNKTQTLEAPATLSQAYEDSIGDDPLFKLHIVDTVEDGDEQKYPRIASVLPLAGNKLLYMWGRSLGAPWNGDAEGVRLYKRILTYDDTYNIVDFGTEELFDYAEEPASATKHVMMGRTKTGRIVIMYDKRSTPWDWEVPNNNVAETMIAFSDDEGVSFTEPVAVPNNSSYGARYMGTTGNIVTLSTGRLVCPTYYASSQSVGLMYSDDDGQNWQESSNTLTISGGALEEPALAVDSEDVLYISSRHSHPTDPDIQMKKHSSKSVDGGETLIDLGYNNDIVSPKVASSMYYDKDKKIMIHTSPYIDGRTDLRIYLSGDRGEAWKIYNTPTETGYPMGYTHVTKLNDGVYVMACERLSDSETGSTKNVGIAFFNLSLIFNNVNDNQGV